MAATMTLDTAAAKQAKQKKVLIALSLVLVVVLAIQLPRILGGGGSSDAAATPATDPATPGAAPAATATAGATTVGVASTTTAAPTRLQNAAAPVAGQTQLASFSLFEVKDPFVPQIKAEEPTAPGAAGGAASSGGAGAKAGAKPTPGAAAGSGATAGSGVVSGTGPKTAQPAPVLAYATIAVGGEPESVELKGEFPKEEPLFVLASLKEKVARIGIAGGSLTKGKTVPLTLGKKLTLVNTATGARYTLELLYTGASPEETASFTAGEPAAATDAAGEPAGTSAP